MNRRFTIDGSDALEARLEEICRRVVTSVRKSIPDDRIQAILLGGGYGRGEGGVLRTLEGDEPYNDLEFYVFLRGRRWELQRRFNSTLHDIAQDLTRHAGIEVEFKIVTLSQIQSTPVTMFYYDLVAGHRCVYGDKRILAACSHQRAADKIPLVEAARLLMNRCSGLLFAKERLLREPFTPDDADFVGRNLAKAQLGFGDALIAALGQYHWSCLKREQRLERIPPTDELPFLTEIQRHHQAGVLFKLHPVRSTLARENLLDQHTSLSNLGLKLWLWLESRRLRHTFTSARDYALNPLPKFPETQPWRNRLIQLREFGPSTLKSKHSTRYPREHLVHALALLLWEPETLHDPDLLHRVQSELRSRTTDFSGLLADYSNLWTRFN